MKYLFDENCSPTDKFLDAHPGCMNVKYRLGQGAKDETILQQADKNEFVIVTRDIEFALDALIDGFYVIYRDVDKQKTSFLKTTGFDDSIVSDFNKFDIKL
ncbi:MAG: DUF5615 family PIN-like protein [Nitrosarchaeum sp.]|jgi:uncharacterized protein with PIN domain|uniref:DUF5615 family PIN-like protein n=1 Tax=Nitrosarchaeum sp. TaxID=2026886 RepID=UPI002DE27521|nr:DUF5615 family PIN-like protein [Nitrosarchaeum sp.]